LWGFVPWNEDGKDVNQKYIPPGQPLPQIGFDDGRHRFVYPQLLFGVVYFGALFAMGFRLRDFRRISS
jgi:hypothetical protein